MAHWNESVSLLSMAILKFNIIYVYQMKYHARNSDIENLLHIHTREHLISHRNICAPGIHLICVESVLEEKLTLSSSCYFMGRTCFLRNKINPKIFILCTMSSLTHIFLIHVCWYNINKHAHTSLFIWKKKHKKTEITCVGQYSVDRCLFITMPVKGNKLIVALWLKFHENDEFRNNKRELRKLCQIKRRTYCVHHDSKCHRNMREHD